jgi:hypothetical protein
MNQESHKSEYQMMMACIRKCEAIGINAIHVDNESGRANSRSIGMRRGVPDLFIIRDSDIMFVELKRNSLCSASLYQEGMIGRINSYGIRAILCKSMEAFNDAISLKARPIEHHGVYLEEPKEEDTKIRRVMKRYLRESELVEDPLNIFAVRVHVSQCKGWPWYFNLETMTFTATGKSKITDKLVSIGYNIRIV